MSKNATMSVAEALEALFDDSQESASSGVGADTDVPLETSLSTPDDSGRESTDTPGTLSKQDGLIRTRIAQTARDLEDRVTFYGPVPKDGMFEALQGVLDSNPDIFWLTGGSRLHSERGARTLELDYLYRVQDIPRMQAELRGTLDEVLGYARAGASDMERVQLAYEWFCTHVRYKRSSREGEDQTAYASLALREAVCAGISRGFQLVLDNLGIQSGIVVGDSDLRVRDRHAWSYVLLDGGLYHVDVTTGVGFFRRTGRVGHPVFLQPDAVLRTWRHIKTDLSDVGGTLGQTPRSPWAGIRFCESKRDLKSALFQPRVVAACDPGGSDAHAGTSLPTTPDGFRRAATLQVAPGVFDSQEEFRRHLDRLLGSDSLARAPFKSFTVYDGFVLELVD